MKLSAIVITLNEEKAIKRCLASLSFADEILVIDSGSTDKTVDYAKEVTAQIFHHAWQGYGAQKNYGASQAHGEWLLFIDADEEVTPELQRDIQQALSSNQTDFYWLRIITVFLGKPLKHLYGHNPRLYKKSAGEWTTDLVHEQVQLKNGQRIRLGDSYSKILQTPLLHHSHQSISSYLESMRKYTTLDAQQMQKTSKHRSGRAVTPNWLLPYTLALRQFVKLLIYRRGILDSWQGIMWCMLSGYYEFTMARKYRALCA